MLKQALNLWKSEKQRRGTTLQRRLILFFICVTMCLILSFSLLLMLFGINGREGKAANAHFDNELKHISDAIYNDFGRLSVDGIGLAQTISESCDAFFCAKGIPASELRNHPSLIEPLLERQMETLLNVLNGQTLGGAFLLLDATVQPGAADAELHKAGIFMKKTLPASTQAVGAKIHCLRGPAQIARDHGVQLLGQWKMEYDISDEAFFIKTMEVARQNAELPLSRLYDWTGRVTLKDNSESGFLLCVPLRSSDGTVFGVCGFEVSDRMFKQLYCPNESAYENVFAVAAPYEERVLFTSSGMIAGNYYLTGTRMDQDLSLQEDNTNFTRLIGEDGAYGGKIASLRLYPSQSPYETERWAVAVLMPESLLNAAIKGKSGDLIWIICTLMLLSLGASVVISRHCLSPVTKAIDSIRSNSYADETDAPYLEIADLFGFLAEKDRENERERRRLDQKRLDAEADAASAQSELDRLADKKRQEVDAEAYAHFRSQLRCLTPREQEVFNLYLSGKTAKEIVELLNFSENALKFHNKNIYEKLGVSSRKELLLYAALMKKEPEGALKNNAF